MAKTAERVEEGALQLFAQLLQERFLRHLACIAVLEGFAAEHHILCEVHEVLLCNTRARSERTVQMLSTTQQIKKIMIIFSTDVKLMKY